MRSVRRFLALGLILFIGLLRADTIDNDSDVGDQDIQALREWIFTKRQVTVGEKGGALSISGEVRAEFQKTTETRNGIKQRGNGGAITTGDDLDPLPGTAYDVEVNLMFDYRADRTWASVKLEFDNNSGVFGGTLNNLKLERAFLAQRVYEGETLTFDVLVGRNRLSSFFESKVEFASFFDGILFRYDQSFQYVDFYVHAGPFVIDERRNHYGYIGELGLLNIAGSNFYAKYNLIDWNTKHYPSHKKVKESGKIVEKKRRDNQRFDFLVSQLILGYKFVPGSLKKTTIFYLAGLFNHAAHALSITDHKKANFGGYGGFSIGELRQKGDWSIDANYQVVAAQCIPDFDSFGIGIGNAAGSGLYMTKTGALTTRETAEGNVNYRGFQVSFEYLRTNNINVLQAWQQSVTLDKDIGPFRRFKQYEIELIYLF